MPAITINYRSSCATSGNKQTRIGPLGRSGAVLEDYVIGKEIGRGAYATVRFGMNKESGRKVAIKLYDKHKLLDP